MKKNLTVRVYFAAMPLLVLLLCHIGKLGEHYLQDFFLSQALDTPSHFVPFCLSIIFSILIYFLLDYGKDQKDRVQAWIMGIWVFLFLLVWLPTIFGVDFELAFLQRITSGFFMFYLENCLISSYTFFYILFGIYVYLIVRMQRDCTHSSDVKEGSRLKEIKEEERAAGAGYFSPLCLAGAPLLLFFICTAGKRYSDYLKKEAIAQFVPFKQQVIPFFLSLAACILVIALFLCCQKKVNEADKSTRIILSVWFLIFTGICIPLVTYCFLFHPPLFSLGGMRGPRCFWFLYTSCLNSSYTLFFILYGTYACLTVQSWIREKKKLL